MQANTGHSQNNQNQGGQQGGSSAKPSLSWSQPAAQPKPVTSVPPPVVVTTPTKSGPSTVLSEKSHTGAYIGIFIAGIIVGALIGWAITNSRAGGSAATTPNTSSTVATSTDTIASSDTTNTTQINTNSGAFTITSPQTAGFAVMVSNLMVSQPTWVVIYEDRAGAPGNALGAAFFLPQSQGTAQSGTVQLLRGTLPGQTYLAGEAIDDGDKIFSLQSDKPVLDMQGHQIMVQFTTK